MANQFGFQMSEEVFVTSKGKATANQFGFQMSEDFLRAYADYLNQLRGMTGKTYNVTLTIDLIPDGVGYEVTTPQITIDEVEPERR